MALTQETILTFLLDRGGKVKNSDLLNHFKSRINCSDPAEKQHNRDLFKKLVNSVAVVKQIDEVKFVVVKKRYQDFVKGGMKADADDSFESQSTSFSPTCPERTVSLRRGSGKMLYSDIQNNNNVHCSANLNSNYRSDYTINVCGHLTDVVGHTGAQRSAHLLSNGRSRDPDTAVKVLSITNDQTVKAGKTGAVFAVVAVKSPPQSPMRQTGLIPVVPQHRTPEKLNNFVPKSASQTRPNITHHDSDLGKNACNSSVDKIRQVEETQAPGSPQLRRTQYTNAKQGEDVNKYPESFPLEPAAHEWLVKSAAGLWGQIYGLLLQDAQLAKKRDFISGFTALHWAAKAGNSEMIRKIMSISKKKGACVDVNSRTHGGYTPLHLAAIHGHDEVMFLLVQGYGAKVNVRDNSGKKPYHYLDKGGTAKVRELLGGPLLPQQDRAEGEDERDLPKGLNTISKLFQPHIGHRKKQRHHQQGIPSAVTGLEG